mmetsp:Transcript_7691/g.11574  ORF Transcript_7691/g.11574 Transcript_7691/m.11574 type:complete len:213 (+) Transcript_7691:35-673(+)
MFRLCWLLIFAASAHCYFHVPTPVSLRNQRFVSDRNFRNERRKTSLFSAEPNEKRSTEYKLPVNLEKSVTYTESTLRSLAKAVVWRITAAIITLISSLTFSKSLATALSIVTSDFLTKSGFMFLGERVWNKVSWGKGKKEDGMQRSLAKALLWRLFAAGNTLICGIFIARDLSVALKIVGSDTVFKTGLFYLNERAWARVEWGKEYQIDFFI